MQATLRLCLFGSIQIGGSFKSDHNAPSTGGHEMLKVRYLFTNSLCCFCFKNKVIPLFVIWELSYDVVTWRKKIKKQKKNINSPGVVIFATAVIQINPRNTQNGILFLFLLPSNYIFRPPGVPPIHFCRHRQRSPRGNHPTGKRPVHHNLPSLHLPRHALHRKHLRRNQNQGGMVHTPIGWGTERSTVHLPTGSQFDRGVDRGSFANERGREELAARTGREGIWRTADGESERRGVLHSGEFGFGVWYRDFGKGGGTRTLNGRIQMNFHLCRYLTV